MKKINLNAPINSLGYGVVGFNVWKNLREITDLTYWAIPNENQITPPVQINDSTVANLQFDISKQSDLHDGSCLKIWHENQLGHRIGRGKFVAWPFFEVNKFDSRRSSHLKSSDEIIVSSQWAKRIIEDQVGISSHVVPCGVDREIFNENHTSNQHKCIFFNCGKWEVRKGHDVLHKAFKDAFSNNDEVELWMMTENPFLKPEETNAWKKLYNAPNVKMIGRVQFQHELASIINNVYCGVFPARSEGWNLEALELMACGKHLIITNYSAHTEFCNNDNSKLINISQEEQMYDGKWFVGDNGTWASLDGDAYDQLVNHLREVYSEWKTSRSINKFGIQTSEKLSWKNCVSQVSNIL